MISQYNAKPGEAYGVKNLMAIVAKSLTFRGFIVFDPDMGPKYDEEHQKEVQAWIHNGSLKAKLSVTEGIDNAVDGLIGMFHGRNFGKAVLKITDLEQVSCGKSVIFGYSLLTWAVIVVSPFNQVVIMEGATWWLSRLSYLYVLALLSHLPFYRANR